jgi:hypothetical protein
MFKVLLICLFSVKYYTDICTESDSLSVLFFLLTGTFDYPLRMKAWLLSNENRFLLTNERARLKRLVYDLADLVGSI